MARNIAIVGAGAIARVLYLPALRRLSGQFDQLWLVDPSERARAAALVEVPSARAAASLADIDEPLEFVVITAPNALHFRLASEALARNAHVLVEKPFVLLPDEGRQLVEMALDRGLTLAVNQTRRFYPIVPDLRRVIVSGELGDLRAIDHVEGVKLDWPFESGAAFAPNAVRTGAVMDFGVHVLDYYEHLLAPRWRLERAIHDGFAGPEGLAEIHLSVNNVPMRLLLSRYAMLRNTARLSFERGEVEFDVFDWSAFSITGASARRVVAPSPIRRYGDIGELVLADFIAAARERRAPKCSGASALPVIELLDEIYTASARYPAQVGAV